MTRSAMSRAEPRSRLSRERVLRVAIAHADGGGLEALSMRRLAEELGVAPMALYRHVANKDDLVDGMVDVVFGEVGLRTALGSFARRSLRPRGGRVAPARAGVAAAHSPVQATDLRQPSLQGVVPRLNAISSSHVSSPRSMQRGCKIATCSPN